MKVLDEFIYLFRRIFNLRQIWTLLTDGVIDGSRRIVAYASETMAPKPLTLLLNLAKKKSFRFVPTRSRQIARALCKVWKQQLIFLLGTLLMLFKSLPYSNCLLVCQTAWQVCRERAITVASGRIIGIISQPREQSNTPLYAALLKWKSGWLFWCLVSIGKHYWRCPCPSVCLSLSLSVLYHLLTYSFCLSIFHFPLAKIFFLFSDFLISKKISAFLS